MAGEESLEKLLAALRPSLLPGDFVFCTVPESNYSAIASLHPVSTYQEEEGLSLVLNKRIADDAGLTYESVFQCISLQVHSSLEAVGLTAAVAGKLSDNGISANVIAAFYHDHIYVQKDKAELALRLLENL